MVRLLKSVGYEDGIWDVPLVSVLETSESCSHGIGYNTACGSQRSRCELGAKKRNVCSAEKGST